jgi:hypothetical protein
MSRRAAVATLADISRAIRAAKACGLSVPGLVVRLDGVYIETGDGKTMLVQPEQPAEMAAKREIVL